VSASATYRIIVVAVGIILVPVVLVAVGIVPGGQRSGGGER
jgi:hypothetical protein